MAFSETDASSADDVDPEGSRETHVLKMLYEGNVPWPQHRMFRDKVFVGDAKWGPTWPNDYTSVAEMASRAAKAVKCLAACRLTICFGGTRVLSVSQNTLLKTLAPASAPTRARELGSEATLSVHHCVPVGLGGRPMSYILLKIFKCIRRGRG